MSFAKNADGGGVGRENHAGVGAVAVSDALLSCHSPSSSASTGEVTTATTTTTELGKKETFPCKVYRMIEHCHENDPKTASFYTTATTLSQERGGGVMTGSSGFIVKNKKKMEEVYLEKFNVCQSKGKGGYPQFESFHRQLNKYGFKRSNGPKAVIYLHQTNLFRRGHFSALQHIKITNIKGALSQPSPPPPLSPLTPPKLGGFLPPPTPPNSSAAAASVADVEMIKKVLRTEVCTMRQSLERFVEDRLATILVKQLREMKEAEVEMGGAGAIATLATEVASIRSLLSSLVHKVDSQHDESMKLLCAIQHLTAAINAKQITVPATADTTNDGNGGGVGGDVGAGIARQNSQPSSWDRGGKGFCCKRSRSDDDDKCAPITDTLLTATAGTAENMHIDGLLSSAENEENAKQGDEGDGKRIVDEPGAPSCTKPSNHHDEQMIRGEGGAAMGGKNLQELDCFELWESTEGYVDDDSLSRLFYGSFIDKQVVLAPQKTDRIPLSNNTSESTSKDTPMDGESSSNKKPVICVEQHSSKKRKTRKRSKSTSGTSSISPSFSSSVSTLTASTITDGSSISTLGSRRQRSDSGNRAFLSSMRPRKNDVLCTNEADFSSHPGNVRHMDLVAKSVAAYRRASAASKDNICRSILVDIKQHGGLFLEQDSRAFASGIVENASSGDGKAISASSTSCWYEMSDEASMKITALALEKAILGTNVAAVAIGGRSGGGGGDDDDNESNGGGDGPEDSNGCGGGDDKTSGGNKRGGNGRGGSPSDGSSSGGGFGGPGTDPGGGNEKIGNFTSVTKSPAIPTEAKHSPDTPEENGDDDSHRQERGVKLHHLSTEDIERSASKPVDRRFDHKGRHNEELLTSYPHSTAEDYLCERLNSSADMRRLSGLEVEGRRKEEGRSLVEEHGKEEERRGGVSFSHVAERLCATILGDNPACSSGPPIALGQQCQATRLTGIDEYENLRRPERRKHAWDLILSPQQRTELLSEKYSKSEINEAIQGVNKIKMHRKMMIRPPIDGIRNAIQATEWSFRWLNIVGRNVDKKAEANKGDKGSDSSIQRGKKPNLPRKLYTTGQWGGIGISHRDSLEILRDRMAQSQ